MKKFLISLIIFVLFIGVVNFSLVLADDEYVYNDIDLLDENAFSNVRGDWEINGGILKQVDYITTGTSFDRMYTYNKAYKNIHLKFEMKLTEACSAESWAGVCFNKNMKSDPISFSGYALVLKDYGLLCFYNWNKMDVISTYQLDGENHTEGDEHTWHQYEIISIGENFTVKVDGNTIMNIVDSHYARGYFSINSGDSICEFRNISVCGDEVNMIVDSFISDGHLTEEEILERQNQYDSSMLYTDIDSIGSYFEKGSVVNKIDIYSEDLYIYDNSKTPNSYLELFIGAIAISVILISVSVIKVINKLKRKRYEK